MVDQNSVSWNQINEWLRQLNRLLAAALRLRRATRPLRATTSARTINGLTLEAAELRAHRVPDREQKQVEEGPAQQRRQFRPGENPDEDSSDHRPDDGSEPDTLDVDASNDGSEQDAQE